MGSRNHSTTYRMQPNGFEITTVRSDKTDASGGGSGYSEPYDLEDFADDTEESAITFSIKRCVHQIGLGLFGSVLTDLAGTIDYSTAANWNVFVKIDTADNFTPIEIIAYEEGTAIPAEDTADGQYYFKALYAIGYNDDGDMAVVADLRNSAWPLLA